MANPTILVVEDSPTELKVVANVLNAAGYQVLTAVDGEQALELAIRKQPDLIVLDILLPKKNGFEVCRWVKTNPDTQNVKVLILSGKDQRSDRFWAFRQGADEYLCKPCNEPELLGAVSKLLNENKAMDH